MDSQTTVKATDDLRRFLDDGEGSLRVARMTQGQEKPVFTSLMSLSSAAELVYKAATKRDPSEDALNNTARMIAARTRVFTVDDGNNAEPAMLMPSEIFEGKFHHGGTCLGFADGRQTIGNLLIATSALPSLISDITALYR